MAEVKGTAVGKSQVKRFYIPGLSVSDTCPACGNTVVHDLSKDPHYIGYPTFGEEFDYGFYCPEDGYGKHCGQSWSVRMKLVVTLEMIDGN